MILKDLCTDDSFWILGWIFLIIGIVTLYTFTREQKLAGLSVYWPNTIGKIVSSEVRTNDSGDGPLYEADVIYQYSIDDFEYSSKRVSYGLWIFSNTRTEKIVNKYQAGKEVLVYYNPDSPKEAVLEPGTQSIIYVIIIVALFFILIGLYLLI
jgi:hypothetical protein